MTKPDGESDARDRYEQKKNECQGLFSDFDKRHLASLNFSVKTTASARVASSAGLVRRHLDQQAVLVTVDGNGLHLKAFAGLFAFLPQLIARPAPEMDQPGFARGFECRVIHPSKHQHRAIVCILHNGRDQAISVELQI
jgi:hypothetical protein